MKLLTKAIEKSIPALRSQENNPDPKVVVKFFTPWTNWTWYITEGSWEKDEDGSTDFMMFGYVVGHEAELGYVSLNELASIRGPAGLKIERDLYFTPVPLSQVKEGKAR